jgi:hypothetical protein
MPAAEAVQAATPSAAGRQQQAGAAAVGIAEAAIIITRSGRRSSTPNFATLCAARPLLRTCCAATVAARRRRCRCRQPQREMGPSPQQPRQRARHERRASGADSSKTCVVCRLLGHLLCGWVSTCICALLSARGEDDALKRPALRHYLRQLQTIAEVRALLARLGDFLPLSQIDLSLRIADVDACVAECGFTDFRLYTLQRCLTQFLAGEVRLPRLSR